MSLPAAERALRISRVFDAPRKLVFETFTNPDTVLEWWGPTPYPATQMKMDIRPGGTWRGCLTSTEDGTELWQNGRFKEVNPHDRIVFTFVWETEGERGIETLVTIDFKDEGGKTRMEFHQTPFQSIAERDGHGGGWGSTFDRLEAFLKKTKWNMSDERTVLNKRVVPYTREQVFKAWTNPELLAQWWGPQGFTNTFHTFELRPGGKWHFTMHGPDGNDYENLCVFEEIVAPERVVLDHIETMHRFILSGIFTTVNNGTHIEFRQVFASADEYNRIRNFVSDANEQNLDRLEAVLQKIK